MPPAVHSPLCTYIFNPANDTSMDSITPIYDGHLIARESRLGGRLRSRSKLIKSRNSRWWFILQYGIPNTQLQTTTNSAQSALTHTVCEKTIFSCEKDNHNNNDFYGSCKILLFLLNKILLLIIIINQSQIVNE